MTNVKRVATMEFSENVNQKHIIQAYNILTHTIRRQAQRLFSITKQHFISYHNILQLMILNRVTFRRIVV